MAFEIVVDSVAGILRARYTGEVGLDERVSFARRLLHEAERTGIQRWLLDFRGAQARVGMPDDVVRMVDEFALRIPLDARIAYLMTHLHQVDDEVGVLLRSSSKENPLLDISPRHIIAAGYSQTGGYLVTFANALHRVLRLGDGAPVFDGYLNAAGSNAAPINQCAAPLDDDDPRRRVQPRDVPFIAVMTESDFNRRPALRREDSDDPQDLFRLFEIAGSGHAGPFAAGIPSDADLAIAGFDPPAEGLCVEPAGEFPVGLAFNAVWQQYGDWLQQSLPFINAPRIETDASHQPVRDALGNALGGWRLPQIEVPLAAFAGSGTPREDTDRARAACALTGVRQPFSPDQLRELYGSRTAWLERYRGAIDAAVADRRLTAEDAQALKAAAARAAPAF